MYVYGYVSGFVVVDMEAVGRFLEDVCKFKGGVSFDNFGEDMIFEFFHGKL